MKKTIVLMMAGILIETVNPVDKDGSTDLRDKESLEKVIHEYYK